MEECSIWGEVGYRFMSVVFTVSGSAPLADEAWLEVVSWGPHPFYWCCKGWEVFVSVHLDINNMIHKDINYNIVQKVLMVCMY